MLLDLGEQKVKTKPCRRALGAERPHRLKIKKMRQQETVD
jgi:hypothetical protein